MTSASISPNRTANITEYILKRSSELENELVEVRRWLHQHAELSWKEYETTDYIAGYLENLDRHHQATFSLIDKLCDFYDITPDKLFKQV